MPTNKETTAVKSIGLAFVVCALVAIALLLTGCSEPQPTCASNPKEARAAGLTCWRDENGTTYRANGGQP